MAPNSFVLRVPGTVGLCENAVPVQLQNLRTCMKGMCAKNMCLCVISDTHTFHRGSVKQGCKD